MSKILEIQAEYRELLTAVLPKLQSVRFPEALDEINLFWIRHLNAVRLFLKTEFSGKDSYVFTGVTYLDYEGNEHIPFLLMGEHHVLDDPLGKYSALCNKMPDGTDVEFLCKQVGITAADNLKILENAQSSILILPLRLLNQSNAQEELYNIGEQTFLSLFDEIHSLNEYFKKCHTIDDILRHTKRDISDSIMFTENDDFSQPIKERYKRALLEMNYMVSEEKSDSYNFFVLIFGCIQQALDIVVSCVEYSCIPYIRYPVTLHYVSMLAENMLDIPHVRMLRFKMSVAFVVYRLCDQEKFAKIPLEEFLKKKQSFNFSRTLFASLEKQGINEETFLQHKITQLVIDKLEEFDKLLFEDGTTLKPNEA